MRTKNTETIAQQRYAMYRAGVASFGDDDNQYPPESSDSEPLPRYCLVERDPHDSKWYDFADTPERLLRGMESDDSDYLPHALIDLDTGDVRLVRVHYDVVGSPVVESLSA
jgi:hypothetical protein